MCSAEKLEGVFTRSPYISQMFVYGDSYKSYLVGVVVLDLEALGTPTDAIPRALCLFSDD
jgi:long-subunit acyl-CoA synthetase (AMP-forming)